MGCGIGQSEPYIRQYLPNSRVYSIDVSERSIEVAREMNKGLTNVTSASYDGETIPFDIHFDVIFVAMVFHHIRRENHVRTLATLRKKLSPAGLLFLFELNPLNPLTMWIAYKNDYQFDKDSRLLSPRYTKSILLESGFGNPGVKYTIFFPNYLSLSITAGEIPHQRAVRRPLLLC